MKKFRVRIERTAIETATLELEAKDEEAAERKASRLIEQGEPKLWDHHTSSDDESPWEVMTIEEFEEEFDAIMPDGSRFDWDERLATVGAKKVPR